MSIGYVRALRLLHRAFGRYPPRHRVHLLTRFLTCPFLRTIDDVPAGGRVLDIGSGHALFGTLLVEERVREVVAVDPDVRKSLMPSPSPRVRKVAGYDDCVTGEFDAVLLYDVVYRMPLEQRREMFARALDRLRPGGTLLVKELDPASWKMRWAKLQEWISDRFLHLTLGSGLTFQTREELSATLRDAGFTDVASRSIGGGYPHPHLIYTARKP